LFLARKNDLAFVAGSKVLIISEHQPTLNPNMPLRSSIYFGRTVERLIDARNLYKNKLIKIPTPEFYVFYNGTKEQPPEQILHLSDSYLEKAESPMLELTVKMININPSARHPLLNKCHSMYEYSAFMQEIQNHLNAGNSRDVAITKAMTHCLNEGIMTDFIHAHGSEVINMLFTQFNLEDAEEVWRQEAYADGMALQVRAIRRKLAKGFSITEIADFLEVEESYVDEIASLLKQPFDFTDDEIALQYVEAHNLGIK